MTLSGFEKLKKELEILKTVKRPKIIASIIEARQHGDLKENAEYHAAREEQSFCEGRIKEIELKLSRAQIIDVSLLKNNGIVVFGSTVTVLNLHVNKRFTYRIVGDDEANFKLNLISINSPIARGLIGKKINYISIVKTPLGGIRYKIENVEYI
ncbi:MAG: transcription elongation factor GreA [Buchnera aphidicola (Nurudea yanoniella)]